MSTPFPFAEPGPFAEPMVVELQPSQQEAADVRRWLADIEAARKFDENARIRYAIDRRLARSERGQFAVGLPIAATYIGILKAFLYVRNPDMDAEPAEGTTPPPIADIIEKATQIISADQAAGQEVIKAGMMAAQQVMQQGAQVGVANAIQLASGDPAGAMPPPDPNQAAAQAMQIKSAELIKAKADELMKPYRQRQNEAKQLGLTIQTVVAYLWREGRLKHAAKGVVGSALTIAVGWLKAAWQEQVTDDPIIRAEMNTLQDNLEALTASQAELAEGTPNDDALRASIEQQIQGLQAKVEVVTARGMGFDHFASEDVQVSTDVPSLENYLDASWIAFRTFMPAREAKAKFPRIAKKVKNATQYFLQMPPGPNESRDVSPNANVSAIDADSYRTGSQTMGTTDQGSLCIWEIWHKTANTVLTVVEGLDAYARDPFPPNPGTKRFYPGFQIAPTKCDGDRHPQSLIQITEPLLMDMNSTYTNRQTHRKRSVPKTIFDRSNLDPKDATAIANGTVQEMIGVAPQIPGTNVAQMVAPLAYAQIDPALYDTSEQRAMLEMAWGIQEALSSSIRTAKTATEADIQQKGTEARTNYTADSIDTCMQELAEYTAQIALQKLTIAEVQEIAGPWAFWPEGLGIDGLSTLCKINIRAGSSGKPHTAAKQQQWATVLPILQNAILQIGQLRASSPEQIADCVQELITETLNRTGERMDASRFLPGPPNAGAQPMQPMQPPQPGAPAPDPAAAPAPTGVTLQ